MITGEKKDRNLHLWDIAADVLWLCKVKIALFAALSAAAGLFLASPPSAVILSAVASGVFLLAAGAGALNNYQERHSDAMMTRTAARPLPAGRIGSRLALGISIFLLFSGCLILLIPGSPTAWFFGLAAVVWYNGFYTDYKRKSAFAAIPGALVGAIPPAIGWAAGGGNLHDLRLAALCFFFFMWQTLHFFVHMLACGGQYEKAGLPSIAVILTESQLIRLTFLWMLSLVASTQLIFLFGVISNKIICGALFLISFWLLVKAVDFYAGRKGQVYGLIFRKMNYYMLMVLLLLILEGVNSLNVH